MSSGSTYFLGIDGGGSKCRARIRDDKGTLLAEALGGSSNIYQDFDGALANILAASREAAAKAGITTQEIHAGLGLAGIVTSVGAEKITQAGLPFASVTADNDAYAACIGAFSGQDGGMVIAGTGSIGYALVGGERHMVGGWDSSWAIMAPARGSVITPCAAPHSPWMACCSLRS